MKNNKIYDDKMTKTINNLDGELADNPCRACKPTCTG